MNDASPNRILITGASSGLGAALALEYAEPGVTLYLGGRDTARLDTIAALCRERGAAPRTQVQDITDAAGMRQWIFDAFDEGPVDLVIANAGIAGRGGWSEAVLRGGADEESSEQVREIMAVNYGGTINTVFPAIERMVVGPSTANGVRGQIAIMSSLVSFRGLSGAPAYCASKAAVRTLGESLRGLLWESGIRVSVVCPGFVRTPMTDAVSAPMPALMEAEQAAAVIRNGLAKGRARIAFPRALYAAFRLSAVLPSPLVESVVRAFPARRTP